MRVEIKGQISLFLHLFPEQQHFGVHKCCWPDNWLSTLRCQPLPIVLKWGDKMKKKKKERKCQIHLLTDPSVYVWCGLITRSQSKAWFIYVFFNWGMMAFFRWLSMSRDGWMRKRASAGDDNGWAERVSAAVLRVSQSMKRTYDSNV